MGKRIISWILCAIILLSNSVAIADKGLEYDNIKVLKGLAVYKKEETVMVPLREIGEKLDFTIEWNSELRQVEVSKGGFTTSVKSGLNSYFFREKRPVELNFPPEMKEGKLYVPIEFFENVLLQPIFLVGDNLLVVYENKKMDEETIDIANIKGYIKDVYKITEERYGGEIIHTSIFISVQESDMNVDEVIVHLVDDTTIYDMDGKRIDSDKLKVGGEVDVIVPMFMSMSLPPQTTGKNIVLNDDMKINMAEKDGVRYPEFVEVGKGSVSASISKILNKTIEEFIDGIEKIKIYDDLEMDYRITYLDQDMMSVVFRGNYTLLEVKKEVSKTLNLDLKSGMAMTHENYFKDDEESKAILNQLLVKAAKQQYNMDYDGEDFKFYFIEKYMVAYYFDSDDDTEEVPIELYIPREDIRDIIIKDVEGNP